MRKNIEQYGAGWAFRYSYTVGGKRKHKRVTGFPTPESAEAAYEAEMKRRKRNPLDVGKLTVEGWLEYWYDNHASLRAAETTLQKYEAGIMKIVEAIGHMPLSGLRPLDIQPMIAAWAKEYKPATVRMYLEPLRAALNHAVRLSYISYNPCAAITLPRQKKTPHKTLTHAQVGKLFDATKGSPLYVPVLLAATAGMRRGEIAGLKWENVHFDECKISVVEARVQAIKGNVVDKDAKTEDSTRSIDVDPDVMAELRHLRESQPATAEYVCQVRGNPIKPDYITRALRRKLEHLGLPHVTVHGLRHSHASMLLLLGVHPKVVQERLGHRKISTTLDIYSHVLPSMQRESAKILADAIWQREAVASKTASKKTDQRSGQPESPVISGNRDEFSEK